MQLVVDAKFPMNLYFKLLVLGPAFSILVGCANLPSYLRPRDRDANAKSETLNIYYATSRKKAGGSKVGNYFSANKSETLIHGICRVEFSAGGSSPYFPEENALKYRDDVAAFYQNLNAELGSTDKPLLVFVHGFSVSFESAILSTAILGRNLNNNFVPFSYSWPSLGRQSRNAYNYDRERRDFAARELVKFLQELKAHLPNRRINIVAHSMGCHILLQACEKWPREDTPAFENIVLAAADVDADDFRRDLSTHAIRVSKRATLYASDGDKALVYAIRNVYQGQPRAGYFWRNHNPPICIVSGIETIDVSRADEELIGHGYFLSNSRVADDLFGLLHYNQSANRRRLTSSKYQDAEYFFIR